MLKNESSEAGLMPESLRSYGVLKDAGGEDDFLTASAVYVGVRRVLQVGVAIYTVPLLS